jgi:hypothetical protein
MLSAVLRAGATVAWCLVPTLMTSGEKGGPGAGVYAALLFQLMLPLPWLAALLSKRRQTLFDRLAGTFVVFRLGAGSTREEKVSSGRRHARVVGSVLALLVLGVMIYLFMEVYEDRDLRARVNYAITETAAVREKMIEYYDREKRWPAAGDIGSKDWNPYPAGGGFRVHADGKVVISFSEKPQLKGRSITLRARPQGEGTAWLRWKCEADPGILPKFLPASCRDGS